MPRGFFFSCFFPRWVETAWDAVSGQSIRNSWASCFGHYLEPGWSPIWEFSVLAAYAGVACVLAVGKTWEEEWEEDWGWEEVWEEEEDEYSLYARLAQDMEHGRVEVIDVDASSDTTTVSAASTITEETFSVSSDSSVEMLPSLTQQRLDDAAARRAAKKATAKPARKKAAAKPTGKKAAAKPASKKAAAKPAGKKAAAKPGGKVAQ
eukprot:TRINITY_DN3669_c1_g1_i5.p1 TRINITY_DN3669_c1_g1~~TRINITY_DN3669_c1_g1_i5.p1  ORF type:complete len:207 (-),score=44.76 TRINITY_DN3669_c1_g1_i5:209-829(-)